MTKHQDRSQSPTFFAVMRTAVVWFVIGGLGSMLLFYLLGHALGLVLDLVFPGLDSAD